MSIKYKLVAFQCEFIAKNNDALHSDLEAVLQNSRDNFLKGLFPNKQETDNFLSPAKKKLAFDSIGSKFKVTSISLYIIGFGDTLQSLQHILETLPLPRL